MLTAEQLKHALLEHFAAEHNRDLDGIVDSVAEDIEYHVQGPHYPDDPTGSQVTAAGRTAVRRLWENYYDMFSSYEVDCTADDMIAYPERNQVFAHVRITATPAVDFEGLKAGKPFRSYSGALCDFDDEGKMTREVVYGSLGQVLAKLRRMREFLAEQDAAEKVPAAAS